MFCDSSCSIVFVLSLRAAYGDRLDVVDVVRWPNVDWLTSDMEQESERQQSSGRIREM